MKNKSNYSRRSTLALAVLALLTEEPMHPYRMQQLIKERGKDEVINVRQPTSIYQTIERLLRDGLLTIKEILREGGRPDRTVYELTEKGRECAKGWLREMLSVPSQEYPDFPVAISFLTLLKPEEVQGQLVKREVALKEALQHVEAQLLKHKDNVPRLFMLEVELSRMMLKSELEWLRDVIEDISAGRLSWSKEWISEIAERLNSQDEQASTRKSI